MPFSGFWDVHKIEQPHSILEHFRHPRKQAGTPRPNGPAPLSAPRGACRAALSAQCPQVHPRLPRSVRGSSGSCHVTQRLLGGVLRLPSAADATRAGSGGGAGVLVLSPTFGGVPCLTCGCEVHCGFVVKAPCQPEDLVFVFYFRANASGGAG